MLRKVNFLLIICMLCYSHAIMAQDQLITGKVRNKLFGDPIKGVEVLVKGTNTKTVTDDQGAFSISAKRKSVLIFTMQGLVTQKITFRGDNFVDIKMEEVANLGEDIVVVGYGTRKRKELTTSVSSVSGKDLNATPIADAAQALQGRVSGVTITQGSGAPGGTGGSKILIRGITSLTGTNNPLIVVDGYPLPDQEANNVLNSFGTGDIENIDVLKDAAAASIYGVRGSNGVILITTKRGKAGKTSLSVDVYRGLQQAWALPKMLNAREYAIINSEARLASGLQILPKLADFNAINTQYGNGTNWLKEIFRKAAMQNVNLTASGGSDKAQFLFSAGYFKQDGIIYNTDFERFTMRFNGDIKVNNFIKIGNSLSLNKFIEHGADTYTPFNSNIILALTAPPTIKPRNDDGSYSGGNGSIDGFDEPNPVYQLEVPQNKNVKSRITGNVYAEINFLKNLKFKASFGADFILQQFNNFNPSTPATGGRPINLTGYSVQKNLNTDYLAEYTLNYEKRLAAKHKINVVAGYTFQEGLYSTIFASRGGNFIRNIPVLNNQVFLPIDIAQISNYAEDGVNSRLISYISRLNYDFDNKAFLTLSVRQDGSSNFAPKNQFALFSAASLAWRLTNEPFLKNVKWLNDLKVRASFGTTGNQNIRPNFFIAGINQNFQYTFGNSTGSGGIVTGAAPSRTFNPDIRWEKNEQLVIGFDGAIFNNKLLFNIDFYQKRSKDLILYVAPPLVSGTYESVPFNTGTLQNRGIDFTLNAKVLNAKRFIWNSSAVISAYKNKVISLGISSLLDNGGFPRIQGGSLRTDLGLPAEFFYGFVTDGIFQSYDDIRKHAIQTAGTNPNTSTAPGDIRFKDLNNDGVINNEDRTNIGNSNPTFTFGLTNNISYGNFEITLFLQGSSGNKVLNFTRWYTEGGVSNGNYSNSVLDRWTVPGSSNKMPRVTLNDPNGNNRVSNRFVEDASYIRLKNLRIGYTLPSKWCDVLKLRKAQVYVSGQNLITSTNYTGMDPEVGGGVDLGFYPQARTLLAGVTIDF